MENVQSAARKMKFYLAPMEEVTGYVYRKVYFRLFGDIDRYFTPFLAPPRKNAFRRKEGREIDPENNQGMELVPQIMTNQADQLLQSAKVLWDCGYRQLNLNLGCPSATVVPKGKGSGFLRDPDELDAFFDAFYNGLESLAPDMKLSVKTRLGLVSGDEFPRILAVYNRYPLSEVIIHPRVQTDFYKNKPDLDQFGAALEDSVHPVCYNGDIFTQEDCEALVRRFPALDRVMIGRGLVASPGLVREIKTGQKTTREELRRYAGELFEGYCEAYGEEKNALYKMKEIWYYLGSRFPDSEKTLKKIKKATTGAKYREAVEELFQG